MSITDDGNNSNASNPSKTLRSLKKKAIYISAYFSNFPQYKIMKIRSKRPYCSVRKDGQTYMT